MVEIITAKSALELSEASAEITIEKHKKHFLGRFGEALNSKIQRACNSGNTWTTYTWSYYCSPDEAYVLSKAVKELLEEAGYKNVNVTQGYEDTCSVYLNWEKEEGEDNG